MALLGMNPKRWWARGVKRKAEPPGGMINAREAEAQGPYTAAFSSEFLPREINPWLYELLREAVPVIDACIHRTVTLDGVLRIEAENDALENAIGDFADNVQVNDLQHGLQQFYQLAGNEKYEQGLCLAEWTLAKNGKGIERIEVADSKGVYFRRADATLQTWYTPPARKRYTRSGDERIERLLRNTPQAGNVMNLLEQGGYRKLVPERLFYAAIDVEARNPYGTSKMRSLEFGGRTLVTINNALQHTWERFGDPIFNLTYKARSRLTSSELDERQAALATKLAAALEAKRGGNNVDFVAAVGRDDDITLSVIGHDNQVLEIEMPARRLLEDVVGRFGLAPWMLGFIWGTSERLADRQVDLVLQESRTRFESAKPGLRRLVATDLRARGITWKNGDWDIVQELPNLKSEMEQAQAEFLRAQTVMMLGGRAAEIPQLQPLPGNRQPEATQRGYVFARAAKAHTHKTEEYVDDAPNLMRLERTATGALLEGWDTLFGNSIDVLGLTPGKAAQKETPVFIFDPALVEAELRGLQDEFVAAVGGADSAAIGSMYQAWLRGVLTAAAEASIDGDAITDAMREQVRRQVAAHGLELVRDAAARAFADDIVGALASGVYDGQNPRDVARALRQRFDAHEIDWERIARSEISAAAGRGKLDQYGAHGITQYRWVRAGGACPICVGLESGGPYEIGNGPQPMTDSHPNCRCTVVAAI